MTKKEAFEKNYPEFKGEVDFALPQQWVNRMVDIARVSYEAIVSQFVWAYAPGDCFGRALPLTEDAAWIKIRFWFLF